MADAGKMETLTGPVKYMPGVPFRMKMISK